MEQSPRVLLLDDDKFLLDMYSMKFSQGGFTVQSSLTVTDALDCLRHGFAADAVVFDLTMPERDGFDFLQAMSAERLAERALKVALTNQNSGDEKQKAHELGADEYLTKATLIPSEVVNTVKEALLTRKSA